MSARDRPDDTAMAKHWIKHWSWLNLRIASGLQERLRRRLTPAGQAVLAATLTAGLFGIDTRQTAASQLFALGLALLAVSMISTARKPSGLAATRRLPPHAASGEPCHYRVRLTNNGRRTLSGLSIAERLPDPRPNLVTFLAQRAPVEARLNPVERLFGYPRWEWLVRQGRRAEAPAPVPLPDLAAGEALDLTLTLTPSRRGLLPLPGLIAVRAGPLGLNRRETLISDDASLLVLPRRWPVRLQPPPGRRKLQPGGISQASSVGESPEFIGLRDYLPGDSPRHIHWAAWARCGEPVVKEYQDEWFSRQALVLDTAAVPPPASPPRRRQAGGDPASNRASDPHLSFECAVSVAASLVEPLSNGPGRQDGLLDLVFFAHRAHAVSAGRGLLASEALLTILATLEPGPAGSFEALADTVIARAPHLSACLLVLLAWDQPRQQLVQRLRGLGMPVRVLLIQDQATSSTAANQPAATKTTAPTDDGATNLIRIDSTDPRPGLALL